jgi:hypothetical protein
MNNIFMGSCTRYGEIYDYSGIWTRQGPTIKWKAVVLNADIVCRPRGTIYDEPEDPDVLRLITSSIESEIDQRRGAV